MPPGRPPAKAGSRKVEPFRRGTARSATLAVPPTPAGSRHVSSDRRFTLARGSRPTVSVYPTVSTVRTLLRARGWIVAGIHATSPDGERYWHLDEALQDALEAEADLLEQQQKQ